VGGLYPMVRGRAAPILISMKPNPSSRIRLAILLAFTVGSSRPVVAEELESETPRLGTELTDAVRLQVSLDRAEFAPGKIDGKSGRFTRMALQLYRESIGEAGKNAPGQEELSDIGLALVVPLFVVYSVTADDVANLGKVPDTVVDQAKESAMPYESVIELVAERFHADVDFLGLLNPEMNGDLKEGDSVTVPNVVPFDLAAVKGLKVGSGIGAGKTAVEISTESSMLTVREDGQLVAAYPVTFGTALNESPIGSWKVTGIAKMPDFRYDRAMLDRGVRSEEFSILPPGPNNPAGVLWIALNRTGFGVHGTNDPGSIGRSGSHGCVRMANWDVARLAMRINAGVPVVVR